MRKSPYLQIRRIEFMVTYQCTGCCMHCSVAEVLNRPGKYLCVQEKEAVDAVKWLAQHHPVTSVMTFGGEPLLYGEVACAIHQAATESGVAKRQLITNGYFSREDSKIREMATRLRQAGVNNLLLSVDAFHQKKIPLEMVRKFAEALQTEKIENFFLQPAWLVHEKHDNPYNEETRKILKSFADLEIPVNQGNDIFLAGNAAKYLSSYYETGEPDLTAVCGAMPYTEPLDRVTSISIEPNGDVVACAFVIGNIYRETMEEIVQRYDPYAREDMAALLNGGVAGLLDWAKRERIEADCSGCYSACDVCRKINRTGK